MSHAYRALLACTVVALSALWAVSGARGAAKGFDDSIFGTPWTVVGKRTQLEGLDISVKDHDGRDRELAKLNEKPILMTFFYTRCENASKCSTTIVALAMLQRELIRAGMQDKVRILAVTYEPHFDTPERLTRFVKDRGMVLSENALAIQLDATRQRRLLGELAVPVNFNAGWVNTHAVDSNLIDSKGRLVRKYSTLLWDTDQMVADLKRLLAER